MNARQGRLGTFWLRNNRFENLDPVSRDHMRRLYAVAADACGAHPDRFLADGAANIRLLSMLAEHATGYHDGVFVKAILGPPSHGAAKARAELRSILRRLP